MKLGDEHRLSMGLGISGSHRTGKSTIAKSLAEANKCPFVTSSASAIAADMGIRPDIGMTMEVRLEFQERVLATFVKDYEEQGGSGLFMSDRTPLDLAAYTLTEWHPERSTPEIDARVLDYVRRCMDATGRYFFLVGVIQPGIPFEARDDKPAPNELYQELLNTTMIGLGADHAVKSHFYLMPREITDNGQRCNVMASVYAERLNGYVTKLAEHLPMVQ